MGVTTAIPLQLLPGLENTALQLFFFALAIVIAAWGFERYRTSFSKTEFWVALLLAVGIVTIGAFPGIWGAVAEALNIESRFITITIVGNALFVFLFMYVLVQISRNRTLVNDLARNLTVQRADDLDPIDASTVWVVIPAYNESGTIGDVVASLPDCVRDHELVPLVVSDGSRDDTRAVAEDLDCAVVEHPVNQGQGGALKTGFRLALDNGADVVVTMDADGQHPPSQLGDLVAPILDDEADYVIGSRYLGTNRTENSTVRELGIRVFTALINVLAKADITDCTSGYRAIRGSRLHELNLTEEQFNAPELIIEARKNGLRIAEVPVTIVKRGAGESKKPKLGYAIGLFRTVLITWLR